MCFASFPTGASSSTSRNSTTSSRPPRPLISRTRGVDFACSSGVRHDFMFATGIENSYPTIANRKRIDEMDKCGHYRHVDDDFDRVQELGVEFLRYGPPLHTTWLGQDDYEW